MRAAFVTGYGDNSVVSHGQLPEPLAGPDEALVEVRAAGINPVEIAMRAGLFHAAFPFIFPQIMGFDIAGVVRSAPKNSPFNAGDEVYARLPNRTLGAYAERVAVPLDLLALKPKRLNFAEAASLPTVALTTWQAFIERARLARGEHILIQAGAGGVGSFAIQLAKYLGATVTATASAANQELMARLGADRTVDYAKEKFEAAGPFDVVYDGVCGPLVERGIASLKPGGRYVGLVRMADTQSYREIGFPEAVAAGAAAGVQAYIKQAHDRGAEFHGPLTKPDGAQLADIAAIVDTGAISATVTGTCGLEGLAAAYDALATGRTRGKLVVTI